MLNLFPALVLLAVDPAATVKHIRDNDLVWLKSQPASELLAVKDARQNTALLWAASSGSVDAVKLLLAAGANPNEANPLGITPLIAAATDAEKVKALLAAGAEVKAKSNTGQHALAAAASSPRAVESVKTLLAAGAPVNERSAQGATPLLSALANSCSGEVVKALLAAGADAKAVDGAGFGAAHGAIACPPDLLKDILARGANVNQQNTRAGKVKHGDIQLIGLSPLMFAATHSDVSVVKVLLDAGADVKAKDIRAMTPLHFAVSSEEQNEAVVKLLLAKGADPAAKDTYGQSPADWASKFQHANIRNLLGGKSSPEPAPVTEAASVTTKGPGVPVALKKLEGANEDFFKQSGCGGCHHSILLSFAASRARGAGLPVQQDLAMARQQRLRGQFNFFQPNLIQMIGPPGDIDSVLYGLLEAKGLDLGPSPEFETQARYLWAKQLPGGSWSARGISRAPIEESDLHRTALAIWLLPLYSDATMKAQAPGRIAEAVRYLEAQTARTTDEKAMKLLGLKWGMAQPAAIAKATKDLAASQKKDGSWGGSRNMPGDAYSTGVALFALRVGGGLPAGKKSVVEACRWLRATQHEDGTWLVHSRAPKFQPYFESGFPYGHDQWISFAGSAWAVAGLVEAGSLQ